MNMLALRELSSEGCPTTGHVDASELGAAIEYHRGESRRLTKASKEHRAKLRALLNQRNRQITELRAAGWSHGRIGSVYKITRERIGQITASPSTDPRTSSEVDE